MTKNEIKEIVISMKTSKNENIIDNLLNKIETLTDEKITQMVSQIGDNEENVRNFIQTKLDKKQQNHEEHTPINEMFTYGITGECIHLHMPIDLHQMISEKGLTKTLDTVNLQLLDAIEKIRNLQNNGYQKFLGKDSIYMISPILGRREIQFLNYLDFKTKTYKKRELQDDEFVSKNPEAQLATRFFGRDKNIGTAIIGLDVVNSEEWQNKRIAQVKAFEEEGIVLDSKENALDEK